MRTSARRLAAASFALTAALSVTACSGEGDVDADVPNVDVSGGDLDVDAPEVDVSGGDLDVDAPSPDAPDVDVDADVENPEDRDSEAGNG